MRFGAAPQKSKRVAIPRPLFPPCPLARRSLLLALAGAGLQACTSTAAAPGPYRIERFGLDSADGQRRYRVQLLRPTAAAPAAGYPLLVMLDGNAAFAALTDELLARQAASGRPLAIATLGYETEQALDVTARAFDYTPPVPGEDPTWGSVSRQRRGGGADLFLDLVEQRVLPEIRRRLPCDPARTTLWGHSYGGLDLRWMPFPGVGHGPMRSASIPPTLALAAR